LTLNFSFICQIRDFGSGQILLPGQRYLSPGFAKIALWWFAAGTIFWLKYRDLYRPVAPPTLSAHTRWPLGFIAVKKALYSLVIYRQKPCIP